MEQETVNKFISENLRTVLGFSLSRMQNRQEAEELASDIIYKMLLSAKNIKDNIKVFAYMWRVAENALSISDLPLLSFCFFHFNEAAAVYCRSCLFASGIPGT